MQATMCCLQEEGGMMEKLFVFGALAIGAVVCVTSRPAYAANLPRYGVFEYSSVCNEAESGDTGGNTVLLIRNGDGDSLLWQWSEGPLMAPAVAFHLAINNKTGAISFSVDQGSEVGQNSAGKRSVENPDIASKHGTITDAAVILDGDGGNKQVIPRVRDFSRKTGLCK